MYHICVSLDVNFNESLTKDVVSFEQLGPEIQRVPSKHQSDCMDAQADLSLHWVHISNGTFLSVWLKYKILSLLFLVGHNYINPKYLDTSRRVVQEEYLVIILG